MTRAGSSNEYIADFHRDGYLVVRQAFPPAVAATIADAVWAALERGTRIRREDASTWDIAELSSERAQTALKRVGRSEIVAGIGTSQVRDALDRVMGRNRWKHPRDWGSFLMTLPTTGEWTVPARGWHIDMAVRPTGTLTCVRMFGFVLPTLPGGGGTTIVAGSHRFTARVARERGDGRAKTLRPLLKAHPWLGRLISPSGSPQERIEDFVDAGWNDGVDDLRVVELVGLPGDVVLWHPGILHAASPNVNRTPRLMVNATIQALVT